MCSICGFICKWVQYRLKTEFRLPLSSPGGELSNKKKKVCVCVSVWCASTSFGGTELALSLQKLVQYTSLMDAMLQLLKNEMQGDELLNMCAYKVKLTMLKVSFVGGSERCSCC
jgi:hypothetical protein